MAESGPSMGAAVGSWVFSVYPPTNTFLFITQEHQRDHGQWLTARQRSGCWGLLALGKPGTTQAGGITILHQFDLFCSDNLPLYSPDQVQTSGKVLSLYVPIERVSIFSTLL